MGNDVDNKGVLWAGDKNFNLYKSMDNGSTYTKIYTLPGAYDPTNPYSGHVWNVFVDSRNYIFASAGGTGGLFRSTNGGISFAQVLKTNGSSLESFYIAMTENNNGYLYTVTYTSGGAVPFVLKSTDGGANWGKIGSFNVLHFHNIRYNPETGYLYLITGEGTQTDSAKIMRSTNGGATWATVVLRNDNLGTVYLGMAFSGRYVYIGQDYPNRICQIHRFYDDGSSSYLTPQVVYNPPADGFMPFVSGANIGNNIIFGNTAENVNGVARIIASADGVNWTVIKSQFVFHAVDKLWNIFTMHPRSGIIFGTMHPGNSYKIFDSLTSNPMPTPVPTSSILPTLTPSPTPKPTPSPTLTPVPTVIPTPTPTPTATPTLSPTPIQTPDPTPTESPIPSPTTEPSPPITEPITSTTLTIATPNPTSTSKPQPTTSPKPSPTQMPTVSPTSIITPTPTQTSQNFKPSYPTNFFIDGILIVLIMGGSFASVAIAKKYSLHKRSNA